MDFDSFNSAPALQIQLLLEIWERLPGIYKGEAIAALINADDDFQIDPDLWMRFVPDIVNWDDQDDLREGLLAKLCLETRMRLAFDLLESLTHEQKMEVLQTYFRVQPLPQNPGASVEM